MVRQPKQGDIILLNVAPRKGHEQTGTRPCIVLSNDIVGNTSNLIIIAPITTTVRVYPFYVEIDPSHQLKTTGKVMLDQLVAIDFNVRQFKFLESVSETFLDELLARTRALFKKE